MTILVKPIISDHALGITPILIKRAAYYLSLGIGEYTPDHPHFDKVVVSKLYDIVNNPENPFEWSMGIVVAFYKDGRKIRWIDFGARVTGAGGDPILREVTGSQNE